MKDETTIPTTEESQTPSTPTTDTQSRLRAAREFAIEQFHKIRRYTSNARRHINEGWDITCTKAKDLHKAGEEYVKAHPTTSILCAMGVGALLGYLMGRRR